MVHFEANEKATSGHFSLQIWRHVGKLCDNVRLEKSGLVSLHTCMSIFSRLGLQCESKKVAPLQLFAVFSLLVNLCNWKLPWSLPKHIPISAPILVHLSEYLCEMYHFYRWDPSNFKNSVQFVTEFMNFW